MPRKEKMKVYHGVPKSKTDVHTVFYKNTFVSNNLAVSMVTGYGYKLTHCMEEIELPGNTSALTIDMWIRADKIRGEVGSWYTLIGLQSKTAEKIAAIVHDQQALFAMYPNTNWSSNIYIMPSKNGDCTHVRVVFTEGGIREYVNGTLHWQTRDSGFSMSDIVGLSLMSGNHDSSSDIFISDLHVSNIDRGDVFENLPQDFIDGKAIVRPRLAQQQIKSDAMQSQVTTVKVPKDFDYYNTPDSDEVYPVVGIPELSIYGDNRWFSGSKIKIKALDGGIIGGVIDSDTALCVVKELTVSTAQVTTGTAIVNDTSKLSIGDTVKFVKGDYSQVGGSNPTISAINGSTITLTYGGPVTYRYEPGDYFFETTVSSSSPVVKTQDGVTVNGTWSRLGTREVLFTIGSNASIADKDLFVTYSLNINHNNSHFTELPQTVVRAYGEDGTEMLPQTADQKLLFVNDFDGKRPGEYDICPHWSSFAAKNSLWAPSDFTRDSYIDYTNYSAKDGVVHALSNGTVGNIAQQMFAFDIVAAVEKKTGCEIPGDKVEWLKTNLERLTIEAYAHGRGEGGNNCQPYLWSYNGKNDWWKNYLTATTASSPARVAATITQGDAFYTIPKTLCDNGYIYLLLTTNPASASVDSRLFVDHIKLEVTLKKDGNYEYLFNDTKNVICNPVMIQKETKTVKRYLPDNSSFVTECMYNPYKNRQFFRNEIPNRDSLDILAKDHNVHINSMGTGAAVGRDVYRASIVHLHPEFPAYQYVGEPLMRQAHPLISKVYTSRMAFIRSTINGESPWDILPENIDMLERTPFVLTKPMLERIDGELFLSYYIESWFPVVDSGYGYIRVPLPNRPLIK